MYFHQISYFSFLHGFFFFFFFFFLFPFPCPLFIRPKLNKYNKIHIYIIFSLKKIYFFIFFIIPLSFLLHSLTFFSFSFLSLSKNKIKKVFNWSLDFEFKDHANVMNFFFFGGGGAEGNRQ